MLDNIVDMPNIPFYHQIWNDVITYKNLYSNFYDNVLRSSSILSKLIKNRTFIAVPDDSLEVDRKMLQEFFLKCGSRSVAVTPECQLMSHQDNSYVSVSRTSRMIVISHVKLGKIVGQSYIESGSCSTEQLSSRISSLVNKTEYEKLPIYLSGEKMFDYLALGCFVETESLLDNYIVLTEKRIL